MGSMSLISPSAPAFAGFNDTEFSSSRDLLQFKRGVDPTETAKHPCTVARAAFHFVQYSTVQSNTVRRRVRGLNSTRLDSTPRKHPTSARMNEFYRLVVTALERKRTEIIFFRQYCRERWVPH